MQVLPYSDQSKSKKIQIAEMFDAISGRYDFLNRLLSARTDLLWRKKALQMLLPKAPTRILDVATGTADFALQAAKLLPKSEIHGVDISKGMLKEGEKKVKAAGLEDRILLQEADAEQLPFEDQYFDAAMISFGIRNFENPTRGLMELWRVLRPGGSLLILEFSKPHLIGFASLFRLYFYHILPRIGRLISREAVAYSYLSRSVAQFPEGNEFINLLRASSYTSIICKRISLGIASIYLAEK